MAATPTLTVDLDRVERNIARMAEWAASAGVSLRPHVKTHKSVRLAQQQVRAGAAGITVATVGEAECFAAAGFTDIAIAYPLWIDEPLAARLNDLTETTRLILATDSAESFLQAAPMLSNSVEWRIEVDSGHHRTGVPVAQIPALARLMLDSGARLDGAFSFPGHSYGANAPASAANDEHRTLEAAREAMRAVGCTTIQLSGGSTPSMPHANTSVITEFRPGVYVFGDAQQWELGTCSPNDIALWAEATVVSAQPGRYVTNAGSKILGADRASYATGYGRVLDDPDARIVLLSEHHSVIESGHSPQLGSHVRIVPNHVCNAVNLVEALTTTTGERIPVDARGHNS